MKRPRSVKSLALADRNMIALAIQARARAYAPYSQYFVGSVVRTRSGKYYSGCNVENACYPAGLCAERTAIAKMVSEGEKSIDTIMVLASSLEPVFPCGMCLQVIQEFGKKAQVIAVSQDGKRFQKTTLDALFPFAFDPEKLKG